MAQGSFTAAIDDWVKQSEARLNAVFRHSAQTVAEEVVSAAPIRTGFLRHSFTASGSQMPVMRADAKPVEGQTYAYESGPVNLVVLSEPLGGIIFMGFVAIYARKVEERRGFVRLTAQRWPQIVAESVAAAKAAVARNTGQV